MPTASKLFGALCFALMAFVVSEMIKPLMPPGTNFGWFSQANTAVGLVIGWTVLGPRGGRGWSAGISNGFTGTISLVVVALFVQSCNEMIARAFDNKYDGVMEALASIFEIMIEFGTVLLNAPIIATLLVGGIIAGLITEAVARVWR